MYYIIYKITNNINGKFYIGKHQTKNLDDGYMGSGKLIQRAIKKHGTKNFTKEILFIFDNEQDMNNKEKELVTLTEQSYNLCPGGKGGFGHINNLRLSSKLPNPMNDKTNVQKRSKTIKQRYDNFYSCIGNIGNQVISNRMNDAEWRKTWLTSHKEGLPKNHQKGKNNSQYGKRFKFVNDGKVSKKVLIEEYDSYIKNGFLPGRITTG